MMVPSWSFGLTLDNILIAGSVFGAFDSGPEAITQATGNSVIVAVAPGQVLRLVNTSFNSVDLVSSAFGSAVPNTAASISITLETAL